MLANPPDLTAPGDWRVLFDGRSAAELLADGDLRARSVLLIRGREGAFLVELSRVQAVDPEESSDAPAGEAIARTLEGWREGPEAAAGEGWPGAGAFAESLRRAGSRAEVLHRLREHADRLIEGHTALLLVSDGRGGGWRSAGPIDHVRVPDAPRLRVPGVWRPTDGDAGTDAELLAFCRALGASHLVHLPVDHQTLLVLAGRGGSGELAAADWRRLAWLAQQALLSLGRLAGRSPSFTDPLTGLASTSQMEAVGDRLTAAARRGEPLALVVARFETAESGGDAPRDDRMRAGARVIRETVRASDLVVHQDGRFLIFLPKCDVEGARRVVFRLRERCGPALPFGSGISEFSGRAPSTAAMIEAGEAAMRRNRALRSPAGAPVPDPRPASRA